MPNRFGNHSFSDLRQASNTLNTQIINGNILKIVPVGSYEVTDGAYSDIDLLVLFSRGSDLVAVNQSFIDEGWTNDGSNTDNVSIFSSYRKIIDTVSANNTNLILTNDEDFFNRFEIAAMLCKRLNLHNKDERIFVHDVIINRQIRRNIDQVYTRQ